jgi:hypothetical protein
MATVVAAVAALAAAPAWQFTEHIVATDLTGGYHVVAADMNGDRRPDLLALGSGSGDLVWFENPSWTRHAIARGVPGMINADVSDVDGDGLPEVALASGFSTTPAKSAGVVSILTRTKEPDALWSLREIDRLPTSHRLRWIDADGSGKKVLINGPLAAADAAAPDYRGHVPIAAYNPGDWKRQIVTNDEEGVVHGIAVVDWDRNGREALLIAGFLGIHLHRYKDGAWQRTRLAAGDPAPWPKSGSSDVVVARANGERVLGAIEPWHGNQIAVYREKSGNWARTVIDTTGEDGHTLTAADLDGDGSDELIAGQRGQGGRLTVYRINANGGWDRVVVAEKSGPFAGCAVADLNGDRRIDIACIGGPRLVWFENGKRSRGL